MRYLKPLAVSFICSKLAQSHRVNTGICHRSLLDPAPCRSPVIPQPKPNCHHRSRRAAPARGKRNACTP
uniref:Uncharacterized protein n=1 Tax=Siphoviridae sp. ctGO42 TaxID=2827566 RepID=A0A8S5LJ31_9CAUD|nr:MAG TPA: hypothetical protein [Siphoviridae sp. ctGO42]